MTKSEKDMEIISGDGLRLRKDCNKKLLEIKGDGCRITIGRNFGKIRVIGDGCQLKVIENIGTIEYKGDGGRVDLGPNSSEDKVTFIGHGSHVKYLNEKSLKSNRIRRVIDNDNDDSRAKIYQQNILQNEEKNRKTNCIFENENQSNERREERRCKMNNEKKIINDQSSTTVIVTKIILDANGKCHTNVRTICKNANSTRC